MIASLASADQRTRPAPFGHALAALAENRPEIVGLTADLGKYTDLHIFAHAILNVTIRWAWPSSC